MLSCLIFAIEEFSTFDGPGIRTSVFLKGCPLRCEWCHNPEGQTFINSVVRSENGCIKCGNCLKYSVNRDNQLLYTERSISSCPSRLLRYCATEYSPKSLVSVLEKNIHILNTSGGGVTFSGGEPTSNDKFLLECLRLLRNKTHRAVQTSGFCSSSVFKKVLEECEYILFDIKIVNENEHVRYTGVSNKMIIVRVWGWSGYFCELDKENQDHIINRTEFLV